VEKWYEFIEPLCANIKKGIASIINIPEGIIDKSKSYKIFTIRCNFFYQKVFNFELLIKEKIMDDKKNLINKDAIEKLRELAESIDICMFCSHLKTDDGASCRPMSTQKVCDQGNVWFFSSGDSDKNKEIEEDKNVQLFYSHPGKDSYMIVNGEAEIIFDRDKIDELWSPEIKAWFPEGKDDPNISIIKVVPTSAYYWDTEGGKMINFFKILASAATGKNFVDGNEGNISI
jgi:general stress protein 26